MECGTFNVHRQDLFVKVTEADNGFTLLDENEKFIFLLSNPEVAKLISEHLNKTLQIRKFLVENPKQNG